MYSIDSLLHCPKLGQLIMVIALAVFWSDNQICMEITSDATQADSYSDISSTKVRLMVVNKTFLQASTAPILFIAYLLGFSSNTLTTNSVYIIIRTIQHNLYAANIIVPVTKKIIPRSSQTFLFPSNLVPLVKFGLPKIYILPCILVPPHTPIL